MKLAVLLIVWCLCIYAECASEKTTIWGNVNAKEVGSETVIVPSTIFMVQTHTLTFPKVCKVNKLNQVLTLNGSIELKIVFWNRSQDKTKFFLQVPLTAPIIGIKHTDYKSHPVSVAIVGGGLGQRTVTLKIKSQRGHGINSRFTFYALV